ncbi:MAG: sugar ABC transporter ATP-binding protein [Chloroflexi bacterium]|nr:MAG: sugar ABC transporter ATP-binding protein [Chloroflexota bacterium]TMF53058.1 MAG: sugar ABC transporter ATP-binding protein [Chloroflexota bacterium]
MSTIAPARVVLEAAGIRKQFPGVVALDDVSLRLRSGEIQALVGENGAGKSTLIKILTGVYQPDAGSVTIDGAPVRFGSARDALKAGISVVHQEHNLIPQFTVAENILLERIPTRLPQLVDYAAIYREARPWMKTVGLDMPATRSVSALSAAQMQLVEIAKALSLQARILLLDEPTAAITPHETGYLFRVLRELRAQGVAVVFVSHKLEEVFELADRVTVLRDGRNTALDHEIKGLTQDQMVTYMIGRSDVLAQLPARPARGEPVLEVRDLATEAGARGITFSLHRGEILGLYGLVGAGRTELAKAIIGELKVTGGDVLVRGRSARIRDLRDALARHRIGYVSENRKEEGLILLHSVLTNMSITIWRRLRLFGQWIRRSSETAAVMPLVKQLDVRAHSLAQQVGTLSGGNQQKVSLGKWLAADVEILIIDEPTIGIDIKTKNALHELIWNLAANGKAIMVISSDMPEIVRLADRILIMRNHRLVGDISNSHDYEEVSAAIMSRLS